MKVSPINCQLSYHKQTFGQNNQCENNASAKSNVLERSADICFCLGIILTFCGGDSVVKKIKNCSAVTKIGIGALITSGVLVFANIINKIINNKNE